MTEILKVLTKLLVVLQLNGVISTEQLNYILEPEEEQECSENKDAISTSSNKVK